MTKILLIEENRELNRSIASFLKKNGYQIRRCQNEAEAQEAVKDTVFDLVITGVLIPENVSYAFIKRVRSFSHEVPILFLANTDDFAARQRGFRVGIDDYLTKPVDLNELLLRVGALQKNYRLSSSHRLEVGSFSMDLDTRSAELSGKEIRLTTREFNLLYKLLSHPKIIFSRQQLMDEFWDPDTKSSPRTVDVYMTKLRYKLAGCEDFEIQTIYGMGYKAVLK